MNVLIYRLPRDKSVVTPPSSCPVCENKIKPYDNIPLFSWILLGGKCRFCKTKIPFMYPTVELVTGILFLLSYIRFGLGWELVLACCMIFTALSAGFTDLFTAMDEDFECGIIPDSLIVFGLITALLTVYITSGDVLFSLKGAAVGFLGLFIPSYLYKLIRKRDGMGGGDIKLVAVFGAFLGVQSIFFIIFASALMGAVIGIAFQTITGKREVMLPFGPFISAAAVIYLFYSEPINRLLYT